MSSVSLSLGLRRWVVKELIGLYRKYNEFDTCIFWYKCESANLAKDEITAVNVHKSLLRKATINESVTVVTFYLWYFKGKVNAFTHFYTHKLAKSCLFVFHDLQLFRPFGALDKTSFTTHSFWTTTYRRWCERFVTTSKHHNTST